mgnify:CR=1 FL=1
MAVYICGFVLSCLFIKISESYKKNRILKSIFASIAIVIPCLIAGLRFYTIGTDTRGYIKPMFNFALNTENYIRYLNLSWQGANGIRHIDSFEKAFSLLVFVIASITKNFHLLLFVIHLLILVPIYSGLKKFKSLNNSKWLAMLIFYFMFFNVSLNIVRQYIGIAIVFWGTSCLLNDQKGKLKFFISIAIACLFHNSSILGLVIYFIYLMIGYNKNEKKVVVKISQYRFSLNTLVVMFLIIFSVLIINNASWIAKILDILNMGYYGNYINGDVHFVLSSIIELLPIAVLFLLCGKKFIKKYENSYFLIINYVLNYLIIQISSINPYASRIGYIFSIFNMVLFTEIINTFDKKISKAIVLFLLVIYLFTFWYYNFVYLGRNETIPYVFYNKLL